MSQLPVTALHPTSTPGTVAQRLDARIQALQNFYVDGVPERARPHLSSLTRLRKWDDPGLGIYPIGSPNDFTKRADNRWREKVATIEALAKGLSSAPTAPSSQPAQPGKPEDARASKTVHAKQLARVASQYASERTRANALQNELDAAHRTIKVLERRLRPDEGDGT